MAEAEAEAEGEGGEGDEAEAEAESEGKGEGERAPLRPQRHRASRLSVLRPRGAPRYRSHWSKALLTLLYILHAAAQVMSMRPHSTRAKKITVK